MRAYYEMFRELQKMKSHGKTEKKVQLGQASWNPELGSNSLLRTILGSLGAGRPS
jgi:hypothetical protein